MNYRRTNMMRFSLAPAEFEDGGVAELLNRLPFADL